LTCCLPRVDRVQILCLGGCSYSVASLPLLAGLASLEQLRVNHGDWEWPTLPEGHQFERHAIASAFLALVAPACPPGLLEVGEDGGYDERTPLPLPRIRIIQVRSAEEWVEDVLGDAWAELQRRRPTPADLQILRPR
jgi:hypothetical protein